MSLHGALQPENTENCLQCQKWSPYKGRGAVSTPIYVKEERNGLASADQGFSCIPYSEHLVKLDKNAVVWINSPSPKCRHFHITDAKILPIVYFTTCQANACLPLPQDYLPLLLDIVTGVQFSIIDPRNTWPLICSAHAILLHRAMKSRLVAWVWIAMSIRNLSEASKGQQQTGINGVPQGVCLRKVPLYVSTCSPWLLKVKEESMWCNGYIALLDFSWISVNHEVCIWDITQVVSTVTHVWTCHVLAVQLQIKQCSSILSSKFS